MKTTGKIFTLMVILGTAIILTSSKPALSQNVQFGISTGGVFLGFSSYDNDGYDRYGYDRDGYDRDGYNRDNCNREGYYRYSNNYRYNGSGSYYPGDDSRMYYKSEDNDRYEKKGYNSRGNNGKHKGWYKKRY